MAAADGFRMKKEPSLIEWIRIYALYRAAFPSCEHMTIKEKTFETPSGRIHYWLSRAENSSR